MPRRASPWLPADRAVMAGRRVAAGKGGRRIRIACAETMTAWVLGPVLRDWRRRFPDVELDLKEDTSADRMLDVLPRGWVDITVGPPPTRTDEHIEVLGAEGSWWSLRPSTGSQECTRCRWPSCPASRSFTTTQTMGIRCGSVSSRRSAASCCRSRRCARAARARPRSWPPPAWGWRSCPSPLSYRGQAGP